MGGPWMWFAPRRTSKHTIPFDVAGGYGISRVEVKIDFQPNRESCELLSAARTQKAEEKAKGNGKGALSTHIAGIEIGQDIAFATSL